MLLSLNFCHFLAQSVGPKDLFNTSGIKSSRIWSQDLQMRSIRTEHGVRWQHISQWKLGCYWQFKWISLLYKRNRLTRTGVATYQLMKPHKMIEGRWKIFSLQVHFARLNRKKIARVEVFAGQLVSVLVFVFVFVLEWKSMFVERSRFLISVLIASVRSFSRSSSSRRVTSHDDVTQQHIASHNIITHHIMTLHDIIRRHTITSHNEVTLRQSTSLHVTRWRHTTSHDVTWRHVASVSDEILPWEKTNCFWRSRPNFFSAWVTFCTFVFEGSN